MSADKVFTTSRRVLARDFSTQWLQNRARELCLDVVPRSNGLNSASLKPERMHRKVWEFAAICQVFRDNFAKSDQKRVKSLGFGCGKEPIPAWLALRNSVVVATDGPNDTGAWTATNQRASRIDDIPWKGICSAKDRLSILFSQVDMNQIPDGLLRGDFDFTWSCGSFEHIGGIDASLNFFCAQMKALNPGGIAAHTTEYNFGSDADTLNAPDLVLFRAQDLERLDQMLSAQGDRLYQLDLRDGDLPEDRIIDEHPYNNPVHLALKIGEHVTTSIILIAQRGDN